MEDFTVWKTLTLIFNSFELPLEAERAITPHYCTYFHAVIDRRCYCLPSSRSPADARGLGGGHNTLLALSLRLSSNTHGGAERSELAALIPLSPDPISLSPSAQLGESLFHPLENTSTSCVDLNLSGSNVRTTARLTLRVRGRGTPPK